MSAFSRLASALRSLPSWAARYIDNRLAAVEASIAGLSADGTFSMTSAAAFKAVYLLSADTVALADADASGKKLAIGITVSAPTGSTAVVRFMGIVTGAGSFTAGAPQYVDTTAGGLTETPPSTPNATPIAIAINTSDLLVLGPLGAAFDTLRSTTTNLGAALIGIADAGSLITAVTVEAALQELAQFKADLGSIANGKGASKVAIEDAATIFTAANVEAALAEGKLLIDVAYGARIVHVTQTIAFGDFSALLAGVTTKDYTLSGGALPSNATLLAVMKASDFTGFDDNGGSGTATIVVGTSAGGNQVATSLNVATGQTGFPKQFTAGANGFPTASLTGATVTARIASNHDLNTFTAGSVKLHLYYAVLA